MEIIQNRINSETVNIYTIFDTHFGAANQREKEFRELVKIIEKDKNGYWIGGGDYCMPLDTEILTNRGFITQDKLTVNDSILSYNNGKLVWGKLNGIYKTPKVKMNRLNCRSYNSMVLVKVFSMDYFNFFCSIILYNPSMIWRTLYIKTS